MQKNRLNNSTHSWDEADSLIGIPLDMPRHAWLHPLEMNE